MHTTRRPLLLLLLLLIALPFACRGGGGPANPAPAGEGMIVLQSPHTFYQTFERLRGAITTADALKLVTVVDHAANANAAGMRLPPTRLLIFGNPRLGTPLMQAERSVAIDLPQKMLVWEDAQGRVFVGYNDPVFLARRHNVAGEEAVLRQMSSALRGLAETATAP